MTRDNLKNAERDLHRLFRRYGLTTPVPINLHTFGLVGVRLIPVKGWFQYLLGHFSHLLLGGFKLSDPKAGLLLQSFWETYRNANADHWVFQHHDLELDKCVPFYVHLDEGTGQRKSAVLVFNIQAFWGQETAERFEALFAEGLGRGHNDVMGYMVSAQMHNQRGSSLLSRFLYTIVPKKVYTKKFAYVYDRILDKLASEICALASEGVDGMFPICLGVKGDAPALAKAGHLTRTFQTLDL